MPDSSGPTRPFVIGVTGKIACGKSSVLSALGAKGAETIDADQVYHELIRPGLPLWHALRDEFEPEIVGPESEIDRRALGRIVFGDSKKLRRLDELTHPAIVTEIERRISESHSVVIAIDAVKLIESGMDRACDVVWRIECEPLIQIDRLMQRNGFTQTQAMQRIDAQPTLPRSSRPETIIENNGDLAALSKRVDAAWNQLSRARKA
jgi:dephospho-CoA kinase